MEYHPRNRRTQPWIWILIVLAAVILIFVVWWAVAAQPPDETVVYPPEEREMVRPPAEEQPQVVEREQPVNIYIGRDEPRPNVIVVPRDQPPPPEAQQMEQVNLPDRFRFNDRTWEPSDEAISGGRVTLQDTGARIQGNTIYAEEGAQRPYNEVYIESRPGSDIYIPYTPAD